MPLARRSMQRSVVRQRDLIALFLIAEQIVHGHFECHCDPPQGSGAGKACLTALNLVQGGPGDLGAIGQFIGTPALRVSNIAHSLS